MKGSQEKTAQLQQKNEYLELQRENQDKKFRQMISSRDQLIGTLQVQLKDSKDTIKKSVGQTCIKGCKEKSVIFASGLVLSPSSSSGRAFVVESPADLEGQYGAFRQYLIDSDIVQ